MSTRWKVGVADVGGRGGVKVCGVEEGAEGSGGSYEVKGGRHCRVGGLLTSQRGYLYSRISIRLGVLVGAKTLAIASGDNSDTN